MVMEKIATPTLSDCGISEEKGIDYAASAVKWLLDQSLSVPETFFGRISSETAPVWHQFLKNHQAPRAFANPEELAEYVRKVQISHLTVFHGSLLNYFSSTGVSVPVEESAAVCL